MRPAAWLGVALGVFGAVACRDPRPCNEGTVMLTVTLAGSARMANEIELRASVDGAVAVMDERLARPAGQDRGTIEVKLGTLYGASRQLTVVASARQAGGLLATATAATTLAAGCTTLELTLGGADAGDARDGGGDARDGRPPDGPADGPMPIDGPIDRPVDGELDATSDLPADGTNACPGTCVAGTSMACGMCGMRTCLPNCTWGACMGQGMCAPDASEACGNCNSGRRTCSASCTWGACTAETGCRPGNARPCEGCPAMMQTCSQMCTWPACSCPVVNKRVFVTRERQTGMLGGLTGAHALCTRLANDAGLTGQYRAWLSTATVGPSSFMTHHPGPYVLPGGEMVATSWADLTDGTLLRPIDRDQNGMPTNPQFVCEGGEVWTNTTIGGTPASANDCTGWFGLIGTSQSGNLRFPTPRWTNSGCTAITCASDLQLYCLEQ